MSDRLARIGFALLAPLILFGCVLTPGKFVSTLSINADRTFTFAYKGEVIAIDPGSAMKGMGAPTPDGDTETKSGSMEQARRAKPPKPEEPSAESEAKNREIAAALSKEYGYRSVVYQGKGRFLIDYSVSGTLTHNFVFPFNSDAEVMFPFLAIELRQGGVVRVKAPGFANSSNAMPGAPSGMGSGGDAAKNLDGKFTIDTDAEIVSQNNEDGAKPLGARKTISWRVTALTKDAPAAVLKLAR